MPSVRQSVLQELRLGALTGASPVVEVRGVGPYLAGRLARALGQGPGVLRVGTVWAQTAPMTTRQVEGIMRRARGVHWWDLKVKCRRQKLRRHRSFLARWRRNPRP